MTMTDLNWKIDDTVETLNSTALRRSLSSDERFLADLFTAYRQLEKDKEKLEVLQDIDADTINNYAEAVAKLKEANTELLAALRYYADYENNASAWTGRYGNFVGRGTVQDEWESDKGNIAKTAIDKHKGE